ncbi:MAG: alpha/beta fold hydrolase [Aquincola tertiaricarbonis]
MTQPLPEITPEALFPDLEFQTRTVAGVVAREVGQGPTLILLHGGTGSWTHWVSNIRVLSQHFRLVLPDLPGMGESLDVPDDSDLDGYGEFLLAAVVAGLVPAGAPFLVAGFSYGGVMTAWLAARLPERVAGICLLAPGGFPPGSWSRPPLRPVPAGASEAEINAVHRRNLELMMVGDPTRIDDLTVAMQRRNHGMTRFKSRFLGYRDTLGPSLRQTRCPVLGILPARDPLPQPDAASRAAYLESTAPRITCRMVPGASHWVAFEAPDEVNRLMIEFLGARGRRDEGGAFV